MTTDASASVLLSDVSDVSRLLGIDFTDEQAAAICAPLAPGVVMAGAGTGKTAVMAARVLWLVGSGQVAPEQVLGLTFTNKAAGELAHRVRGAMAALTQGVPAGALDLDAEPTIATYHAFAARLVSEQGMRIGVEPDARLLDDAGRRSLAARVLGRWRDPMPEITSPFSSVVTHLLRLEAEMNEHLVASADVAAADAELLEAVDASGKPTKAARDARAAALARRRLLVLVDALRAEKRRLSLMDFGDQLAYAARIVTEHPDVAAELRGTFAVVLLDEYQDTSVAQMRMLATVFGNGHPVTAVGDPMQAIYGWRGASVRNILSFADDFPAADGTAAPQFPLTQNNRSGERILAAANAVSGPMRTDSSPIGALRPAPWHVGTGTVQCALLPTTDDEVRLGADVIRDRLTAADGPGGAAVLVRAAKHIPAWLAALHDRGITVEVAGMGGLLEVPEIVDLVAMLRLLDDPTANPAMVRILTGPRFRLGAADLRALGAHATGLIDGVRRGPGDRPPSTDGGDPDDGLRAALADAVAGTDDVEVVSLLDAVLDHRAASLTDEAHRRLDRLASDLHHLQRLVGIPLPDLVDEVISVIGLGVEVAVRDGGTEHQGGSPTLTAFRHAAESFLDLDGRSSLRGFLAALDAMAGDDRSLGGVEPSGDAPVTIMTMHGAKGLEFPLVVLPHLGDGSFPSTPAPSVWTSNPGVLPFGLRGDRGDFPATPSFEGNQPHDAFKADVAARELDEERRLAYVAVTRAQQELLVTGSWWSHTRKKPFGLSPFLDEVRQACVAGNGSVIAWAERPEEGQDNPLLVAEHSYEWPVRPDPEVLHRRRAAADAVRAAIAHGATVDPAAPGVGDPRVAGWLRDTALLVAEARGVRSGTIDVPVPQALTASAVVEIGRDPDAVARRLRRPMPRPPARAAARGSAFHTWVEARFAQRPLLDRDDLVGAADDPLVIDDAELRALQEAFESGPYADRAPYAVEAPFTIALGGHVLRGRIDAVYRTDDGFQIVDWKTGRKAADPLQLAVYRLAWAAIAAVPPESVDAVFYVVAEARVERPDLPDHAGLEALLALR